MKAPDHDDEEGRPALLKPTWTIWADVSITRRKWYHLITDPDHMVVFRCRLWRDAMAFLDAEGIEEYRICTPDMTYGVARLYGARIED